MRLGKRTSTATFVLQKIKTADIRGGTQRLKWASLTAVVTGALTITSLSGVLAASDVTPPELTAATLITPSTQDVSTIAGAAVHVYVDAADDLSGMGTSELIYTSPSGQVAGPSALQPRTDSTGPNQWWFDVTIPRYSEAGVWTPTLTMADYSGNKKVWSHTDLMAAGWDLQTTLTGTSDTTAPSLTSAVLTTPATLDSAIVNPIEVSMQVYDELSGLASGELRYTSPSGTQIVTGGVYPGGANNLVGQINMPALSESGTWNAAITLTDSVGNKAVLTNSQLLAAGFDVRVNLSGPSDTTAPTVNNLGFALSSPVVEEVPYGGANITVSGIFADNNSGIADAHLYYVSNDGQTASSSFSRMPDDSFLGTVTLPSYAQSGIWQPRIVLKDNAGNVADLDATELKNAGHDIAFGVTKNITKTAAANETVTSDEENDGATIADPVEASVTSPSGGNISIVIVASDAITDQTNGYKFFDRQLSISAPQESVEAPLTLTFQIDASKIPNGEDETTLQVTRNAVVIPACVDSTTATPDPCVFLRERLADGDIKVSIHSTHASVWGSGFPIRETQPSRYTFSGFNSPVANPDSFNKIKAGSTIPLKFGLGGNFGTSILAQGYPVSVQISCSTMSVLNTGTETLSTNDTGLTYADGTYQYNWKTVKTWTNTCRQLNFKLDDGTAFSALFKF